MGNLSNNIRPAQPADKSALLDLAVATGLFQSNELGELEGMLDEFFAGNLEDHFWIADDDDGIKAAAYYAPEMMTSGTWNLYFIGVLPNQQGKGRGEKILKYVEETLRARGERILLIETSGLDNFELTRKFYLKNGYDEEARIREFYQAGEDKIVFRKAL